MFSSTRTGVPATGWAGACFSGGGATSLGILGTYTKVPGETRPRCADEFHRTPKDIAAVQARFQMAARRRNKPLPTLPHATTPAYAKRIRIRIESNRQQHRYLTAVISTTGSINSPIGAGSCSR